MGHISMQHMADSWKYLEFNPELRTDSLEAAMNTAHTVDMPSFDWPKDKEVLVLTNLQSVIPVPVTSEADRVRIDKGDYGSYLEFYLDMYATLKAEAPDMPVYNIHNHPSYTMQQLEELQRTTGKEYINTGMTEQDAFIVGSVPSTGDLRTWNNGAVSILTRGGIHHMRYNETTIYQETRDIDRATHFIVQDTQYIPSDVGEEEDDVFFLPPEGPRYRLILAAEGVTADEAQGEREVSFADWKEFKNSVGNDIDYGRITFRRPETLPEDEQMSLDDGSLILNGY